MIAASFTVFVLLFLAVGLMSAGVAAHSRRDYYLASQNVSPVAAGLSAVATNNSGYMFIGVIGYTYVTGLASVWLMFGWIFGDLVASLVIHRRLREMAQDTREATLTALMSRWYGMDYVWFRRTAALVTLVFLGAYAAAQMDAGGKALHVLFGWPENTGALVVAIVVVLYCMAGGIRASIWTDVAQSLVMLGAMTLLLLYGTAALGGARDALAALEAVPGFMDLSPPPDALLWNNTAGVAAFAVGWMFAGLSVAGQPHIMVRFIALRSTTSIPWARVVYYAFFIAFYAAATGVGLLSRVLLPELGELDPELALPTMALDLMPAVLVGLILAGIFAATMSTADSLVMSCSASLTNDLTARPIASVFVAKATTVAVAGLALLLAVAAEQSVFSLVIFAWSGLASAFVPLLLVYALRGKPSEMQALLMMTTGLAVALAWRIAGLETAMYEGLPGMLAGLAVYAVTQSIVGLFDGRAAQLGD